MNRLHNFGYAVDHKRLERCRLDICCEQISGRLFCNAKVAHTAQECQTFPDCVVSQHIQSERAHFRHISRVVLLLFHRNLDKSFTEESLQLWGFWKTCNLPSEQVLDNAESLVAWPDSDESNQLRNPTSKVFLLLKTGFSNVYHFFRNCMANRFPI